jgi:hypothetical protein
MKLKLLILFSLLTSPFTEKLSAQIDINNAEAIFIYNFLMNVQWPENEVGNAYVIGIFGNTSTKGYLKTYTANRKIGTKSIEVIQINSPIEAKNCHILLVAQEKSKLIAEIKTQLGHKSCLIVSEKAGSIAYGSVIDFHIESDKLRYKVDQNNAKAQNLIISNKLLSMSL